MKHPTQEIRSGFVNYFKKQGHAAIASSPVIPHQDPTLLFVNAGMNQFKDVFLGKAERDYTRAVTSQKCIRAGGKHNDLENVGHTTRHLTFFEMIGNFSFGDYFKEKAIQYAYEVSTEVFGFEEERIWATVLSDDDEAYELWRKYLPEKRICRMGEKTNFWAMGDTGPCGPCSELLYDRGNIFGDALNPLDDKTEERYLEFWNLVFMQYNRDSSGKLTPLPKQSIDTGSGLERVVSLKMGVNTLYATDVLRDLVAGVEELSGVRYEGEQSLLAPAFHVIADHLRSLSFAIADGAQPSNVDRGYVLRKILRRAVRYGRMLKFEAPFLAKLLPRLITSMQDPYTELSLAKNRIEEILTLEEEAFFRTLKRGGSLLTQVVQKAEKEKGVISGDDAFKLKDTYGLPLEEILLLAKDGHLSIDLDRYQQLERDAKERSKNISKENSVLGKERQFQGLEKTQFEGYSKTSSDAKVLGLIEEGENVYIVLDKTPFYAEKGGQVGDSGIIENSACLVEVSDCTSIYVHKGVIRKGSLKVGDSVKATIDVERRKKIQNNHTATHLLHYALQKVVGEQIKQAGSVVDENRLRFDFNHHKGLSPEELQKIEDIVNEKIRENTPVDAYEISYEEAQKKKEIKQFFGDKYGSKVRVIDIDYSKELCGGTHTKATGSIGYFRIVKEGSISAGVRRIEAVSGKSAEALVRENEAQLQSKIDQHLSTISENQKTIKALQQERLKDRAATLIASEEKIGSLSCLIVTLEKEGPSLKELADLIMNRFKSGILLLASKEEDKVQLLARVSPDLVQRGIQASLLIKEIAPIVGGSGGGRADSAQAGGKEKEKLPEALELAKRWIQQHS